MKMFLSAFFHFKICNIWAWSFDNQYLHKVRIFSLLNSNIGIYHSWLDDPLSAGELFTILITKYSSDFQFSTSLIKYTYQNMRQY